MVHGPWWFKRTPQNKLSGCKQRFAAALCGRYDQPLRRHDHGDHNKCLDVQCNDVTSFDPEVAVGLLLGRPESNGSHICIVTLLHTDHVVSTRCTHVP